MSDPLEVPVGMYPTPTCDDDWAEEVDPSGSKAALSRSMSLVTHSAQMLRTLPVLPQASNPTITTEPNSGHEDSQDAQQDAYGNGWVMTEHNRFRVMWSFITNSMLIYTATLYLYHFSFHTFHIELDSELDAELHAGIVAATTTPANMLQTTDKTRSFWSVMDTIVEVVFIVDIFFNFFISYKDSRGTEILSLHQVAKRYLCNHFLFDLVASMPEAASEACVRLFVSKGESGAKKAVEASKLVKLQRMQRLMRLTRLIRITKVVRCLVSRGQNPFQKWLQSFRGVRIINFLCCLVWTVHVMACGWYLTAALHTKPENTWVARRTVNPMGDLLVYRSAFEQWLLSMYFVLTVFTTVGFGDMSAGTEAEILYVALVMVVGAVVHSIVISEVISTVTSTDGVSHFKDEQFKVVDAFAFHTQLSDELVNGMKAEITYRAEHLMEKSRDKRDMVNLITGKFFSRWFVGTLPDALFRGRLKNHHFLTFAQELTPSKDLVPPSLVCLLAIHLNQCEFKAGEVVFQKLDYPVHMYLVQKGSFANVAIPSPKGGVDAPASALSSYGHHQALMPVDANVHSTGVAEQNSSVTDPRVSTPVDEHSQVYPYRSYSYNNYFGDFELLREPRPRCSTVRCETPESLCLALAQCDFNSICEEFPQYKSPWTVVGRRRDRFRTWQQQQLLHGLSLKGLSALRIQRRWRVGRTWIQKSHAQHSRVAKSSRLQTSLVPITRRWPGACRRPPKKDEDHAQKKGVPASCPQNDQCCEDVEGLKKDVKDLKDMMRLMVKEVAALSSILQSE